MAFILTTNNPGKSRFAARHRSRALSAAALLAFAGLLFPRLAPAGGFRLSMPDMTPQPATAPAAAATAPAGLAATADDLLKAFPGNASALLARPDARNLTLEGRVRDIYKDPSGETRLVLVGKSQADDAPPHFTCHLDNAAESAAANLHFGEVIRIVGALGPVSAPENRINLLAAHDVKLLEKLTLAAQLPGRWSAIEITADNFPGHRIVEFHADGMLTAELSNDISGQILKTVTGKWSVPSSRGDKLRVNVGIEPALEADLHLHEDYLNCGIPGFADQKISPLFSGGRIQGKPLKIDYQAPADQARTWTAANTALAQPQQLLNDVSKNLAQFTDADAGYTPNGTSPLRIRPLSFDPQACLSLDKPLTLPE